MQVDQYRPLLDLVPTLMMGRIHATRNSTAQLYPGQTGSSSMWLFDSAITSA